MNSLNVIGAEGRRIVIFKLYAAFLTVVAVVRADIFAARFLYDVKSRVSALKSDFGVVENHAAFRNKAFLALFKHGAVLLDSRAGYCDCADIISAVFFR